MQSLRAEDLSHLPFDVTASNMMLVQAAGFSILPLLVLAILQILLLFQFRSPAVLKLSMHPFHFFGSQGCNNPLSQQSSVGNVRDHWIAQFTLIFNKIGKTF